MSKKKLVDIAYVKQVLDKISSDQEVCDKFFEDINKPLNVFNGASVLYSIATLISPIDAGIIAYQREVPSYLIEEGNLFEHLSKNPNKEKAVMFIDSFITDIDRSYSNLHSDFIEEIESINKKIRRYQNSISKLEEKNRKLKALNELENMEEVEKNRVKIEAIKKKEPDIQKLRDKLNSNYGQIRIAMFDYYHLAKDLNNKEFLRAIFTQPEYKFKVITDENAKIADNEIAIFKNDDGKIFLKSKFGKKNIELKKDAEDEVGISPKLYEELKKGSKQISEEDQKSLSNFISINAFPGVTQEAIKKLTDSASLTEKVNGFMELLTQEHVKEPLIPLLNQKLLDHVLELPNAGIAAKDYSPLVKSLSSDSDKFRNLTKTLLNRDPEFRNFVSDLMGYINTPYYDENKPESEQYKQATELFNKYMSSLIETALNADVIAAAVPLINEKLIEDIFKLPNIDKTLNSQAFLTESKKNLEKLKQDADNLVLGVGIDTLSAPNKDEIGELSKKINSLIEFFERKPENEQKLESPIKSNLITAIKKIAEDKVSCKKLADAFTKNQESMAKALEKVIDHPTACPTLRGFCLGGKEVAEFLPKVMTEKGLGAIAKYIEKPNTWRLINIFIETKTLGFAISHYIQSIRKAKTNITKDEPTNIKDNSEITNIKTTLEKYYAPELSYIAREGVNTRTGGGWKDIIETERENKREKWSISDEKSI